MSDENAPADATFQDMDNFMDSAFDKLESGDDSAAPESDVSEEEIAAVVEAETNSDAEEVEEDTTEATETDSADEVETTDEPVAEQATVAPQSMSAKDREAFAALPSEQQKWMSDRAKEQEAAFTQKTMDLADKSKSFDRLEQVLGPRRQQLAMEGMDDSTAVGQLFALSDFANTDPVGFVKHICQARGIPLAALTESGGQDMTVDPQLAAMQQKMQGFESFLTNQQTQANQQAYAAINAEMETFAQANEHYSELESEMIPVVAALRQSNPNLSNADVLAKAYKMAIAANEGVSAKVEAAKAAKAETDRLAMAKARAAKAKKAVGANVERSGARPAGKAGAENVEDFIGSLVDERMTA